jgi:tight adherence protein C
MAIDLLITLVAVFLLIALLSTVGLSAVLSSVSPERRRLRQLATADGPALSFGVGAGVVDTVDPRLKRLPFAPKSPKDMNRLRRQLVRAGYESPQAMFLYVVASLVTPAVLVLLSFTVLGMKRGLLLALFAAAIGYLLPGLVLSRKAEARKKQIANGLPDALDLFIVCVEAGCSLDQAIVKASEELDITYPALTHELRLITIEIRAGKPRLEAFKNFAARTQVDDVRSLVALLVQTDKFGTSIAQALRTHAETSRTKRRQRAEERAAKVGVKLVFPLVFFLFPALYVVILGPAVIQFVRVFLTVVME